MTSQSIERLQRHANDLSQLSRNHYIPETETREDDVSHSYSVALLAWQLNSELGLGLDTKRVLQYALVHDFVEVYAGDVNTFASPEARRQKEIDEERALSRLRRDYVDEPAFLAAISEYQAQANDETRFVWACDKIQALQQGLLDEWRCYYELGITDERFAAKLEEIRDRTPAGLLEFYDDFSIRCLASYHYSEMQPTLF